MTNRKMYATARFGLFRLTDQALSYLYEHSVHVCTVGEGRWAVGIYMTIALNTEQAKANTLAKYLCEDVQLERYKSGSINVGRETYSSFSEAYQQAQEHYNTNVKAFGE